MSPRATTKYPPEARVVWSGNAEALKDALAHIPGGGTLAIVGSTALTGERAWSLVRRVVLICAPSRIVSGGAHGIDNLAKLAGDYWGIPVDEKLPEVPRWWSANGKKGFAERNLEIATACTALVRVAWIGSTTYGSGWTRDRAKEMGKPTATFWLERD
jgi:hypothetical protein